MRITKQEEYGVRCILQLVTTGDIPLTTQEIAAREGLSVVYVTKLLIMLRRAGLVKSVRGVSGGYLLARVPERITVGQVMRALGWSFLDESVCQHYPGKLDSLGWLRDSSHLGDCGSDGIPVDGFDQFEATLERGERGDGGVDRKIYKWNKQIIYAYT